MTTVSLSTSAHVDPIRTINLTRDLNAVADLIELCFPIQLDRDGQDYIREMRRAARDMQLAGWLSSLVEVGNSKVSGFVWEEDGRIIGNLSLIPFNLTGASFHMIANVAVHPDFRHRGIARALTDRALSYLRKIKETYVWLQVRDDNPVAYALYRSVGFVNQVTRTTWRIRPFELKAGALADHPGLTVRRRQKEDWVEQERWLKASYPALIRWNLPVNFRRFDPDIIQRLSNFLDGVLFRHWAFESHGRLQSLVTWQKTDQYADNLWLAFPEEGEEEILPEALGLALGKLSRRHPLSIDYPRGRCEPVFRAMGFRAFRSLIWMQCRL